MTDGRRVRRFFKEHVVVTAANGICQGKSRSPVAPGRTTEFFRRAKAPVFRLFVPVVALYESKRQSRRNASCFLLNSPVAAPRNLSASGESGASRSISASNFFLRLNIGWWL